MVPVAVLYEAAASLEAKNPSAARDLTAHILETYALPEALYQALERVGGTKFD
jgi:hypothetical protein